MIQVLLVKMKLAVRHLILLLALGICFGQVMTSSVGQMVHSVCWLQP